MSTSFASDYTVAALSASERSGNRPDECSCCDRAGLKHIVKLRHRNGGVAWMGTGCAAKALYGPRVTLTAAVRNRMADEASVATKHEAMLTERRDRYAAALIAHNTDDLNTLFDSGVQRTFHTLGGFAALGSFPAWLAFVAETGCFTADEVAA